MKILLITPGINKKYNDNYHSYRHIVECGNKILAISNIENINKGGNLETSLSYEKDGELEIYRPYKSVREQNRQFLKHKRLILDLISNYEPDIIFCEEIGNFRFSLFLKRYFKIPLILRSEYTHDPLNPYKTMARFLKLFQTRLTGDFVPTVLSAVLWRWIYKNSDAVVSCYFKDRGKQPHVNGTPFYYVPWPTHLETKVTERLQSNKSLVFIGALDDHKNISEFLSTIPKLLQQTPTEEFYIVGMGKNLHVVEELVDLFPGCIKHIKSLPRRACLDLIKSSFLAYSPSTSGGWGFIGDAWAMKTPLIVTNNHYEFQDKLDAVVTTTCGIVDRVNELYEDQGVYKRLQRGGYERFHGNHTSEAVGREYLKILKATLEK